MTPAGRAILTRERDGVIARICLNRPEDGNRVTPELAQALCTACEEIELDSEVRVVELSASGGDFCLGVRDPGEWQLQSDWVAALARLPMPVIAAVQGRAQDEGFELALAADLRLAARSAELQLTQLANGRFPCHGATQRLPRVVGAARALQLLLLGDKLPAAEAERLGLLVAVDDDQLAPRASALVKQLAQHAPLALRLAKEAVLAGGDLTISQGMRLEHDLYVLLHTTADRAEGVDAFLRRRAPIYRGE